MADVSNDDIMAWIERGRTDDFDGVVAVISALDEREARTAVARLVGILTTWTWAQDDRLDELESLLADVALRVATERRDEAFRAVRRFAVGTEGLRRVLGEMDHPLPPQ